MKEPVTPGNYMVNDLGKTQAQFLPGALTSWHEEPGRRWFFRCDNEVVLMVRVMTSRIVRFRFAPYGEFPDDFSYALDPAWEPADSLVVNLEETPNEVLLNTGDLVICLERKNLKVTIRNSEGLVVLEDEKGFHWEENHVDGGEIVMTSKYLQAGEHFYGLGDKSCRLELRKRRFEIWGSDTYGYGEETDPLYKNIPFYVGLHHKVSYGIFFDNSFRSFFDFGAERSNVTSFFSHGGEMNYYFIYGPTQQEVAQQFVQLTGRPEMPPLWALGYHQCKWSYDTEATVREVTQRFRKLSIPCDAIYLDIDYMDGFRCFTWDRSNFADPKALIRELKDDGFKTVVIIDPGIKIDRDYWVYEQGCKGDYFCRRADGPLMRGSVWPGLCYFPDFTRPDVREWWQGLFRELIGEDGVSGVWTDMNEPAVFETGTFPLDVRHDYDGHPCSHRKGHNVYGMQMARATYEGLKRFSYPRRPFVITRSAYAGTQRFSCNWTGDNVASWKHLRIANVQCQRLSLCGMSFTGSDIGGFIESPDGELYIRWLQMAVFHPFCRTHSSGDHGDQEPWSFGDAITELARKYIELRYRLLPYIYTTFWQYVTQGTPMLRSLVSLDEKDQETYYREEEFALGDALLICPVSKPGVDGRWLYLTKGVWYDFWTDTRFDGGADVWANAPLETIPLFVKAGSIIPMRDVQQYVGEKKIEELSLHIYYIEGERESVIYEDEGDGYGYEEGNSLVKTFSVKGSTGSLAIAQTRVGGFTEPYAFYEFTLHGLPGKPLRCRVDGAELALETGEDGYFRGRVHPGFEVIEMDLLPTEPVKKAEPPRKPSA